MYKVDATTLSSQALATGEATMSRLLGGVGSIALTSGTVILTYFTARKTETVNNLRSVVRGTAAAGLTLAKMGVYSVAANGDLTRVAITANDTALWTVSTFTAFTKATLAGWNKVAASRYAFAVLAVGTTMPVLYGNAMGGFELDLAPRAAGALTAQADLPANIANAALSGVVQASMVYGAMTP